MKKFSFLFLVACCLCIGSTARAEISSARAETIVGESSWQVLTALKNSDWPKLASFVDPVRGLQTSPYINVSDYGPQWNRDDVRHPNFQQIFMWGRYDGRGDSIYLKWKDYFAKFVYDREFQNVRPRFNRIENRGNTINNLRQRYPNGIFVEYYWADSGDTYYNWSSLWLVWQPIGTKWFLSGLAHDQWTI